MLNRSRTVYDEKMQFLCDLLKTDPAGVRAECKRLGVSIDQYYNALRAELAHQGYAVQR